MRVRQGANNDLTVKIRVPAGNTQFDASQFRGRFPCEINRTGAGEDTDYSVKRKYQMQQVPETSSNIFKLLSPPQKKLLQKAPNKAVRRASFWKHSRITHRRLDDLTSRPDDSAAQRDRSLPFDTFLLRKIRPSPPVRSLS